MSTDTATPTSASIPAMRKVIDDQRAAEVAGRNLYQTFLATAGNAIRKARGRFMQLMDKLGVTRVVRRVWSFFSPYVAKAGGVVSKIGVLPALLFGLSTHRGRHYLLSEIPVRVYRVVSYPVKALGRAIAWAMDKVGLGDYADSAADKFAALEQWVGDRVQDGRDWLDHHHSSWGMRIARNGLFALLAYRVVSYIPSMPLQVIAFLLAMFVSTSEVTGGPGEIYPDSPVYTVFDAVMTALGRTGGAEQAADVTAGSQRAPKPSDLARQAGEQAKADALAAGANRPEARRIERFTRQAYMAKHAPTPPAAPVVPAVPATA